MGFGHRLHPLHLKYLELSFGIQKMAIIPSIPLPNGFGYDSGDVMRMQPPEWLVGDAAKAVPTQNPLSLLHPFWSRSSLTPWHDAGQDQENFRYKVWLHRQILEFWETSEGCSANLGQLEASERHGWPKACWEWAWPVKRRKQNSRTCIQNRTLGQRFEFIF